MAGCKVLTSGYLLSYLAIASSPPPPRPANPDKVIRIEAQCNLFGIHIERESVDVQADTQARRAPNEVEGRDKLSADACPGIPKAASQMILLKLNSSQEVGPSI